MDTPKRRLRGKSLPSLPDTVRAIANVLGVRYDPERDAVETVLKECEVALMTTAFVHRNLWGVFEGTESTHELVPHHLPEPVCVSLTRGPAEVKASLLSTSTRHFYVQNHQCFGRVRDGRVEVVSGTTRVELPLI